jgi:3-phenylpropionate/trans-cinnamate dioxygenase ferredoxin subunit
MSESTTAPLGDLSDLGDGQMRRCRVGDTDVLVCRVKGSLYAIDDTCSHADESLSEGFLSGFAVSCPLHGAQFDVRTGQHLGPPAYTGVRSYPVHEEGAEAVLEMPVRARRERPDDGPQMVFRTR